MPLSGDEIKRLVLEGGHEGLLHAAKDVLREAEILAPPTPPFGDPHPDITLKLQGRVEVEPGGRTVKVVFDGPYAAVQHEALHYKHPRGGSPKFLERPLTAIVPFLPEIVASEVRARMKAR